MLDFLDYLCKNYVTEGKGGDNEQDTTAAQTTINMDELAQKVAEKLSGISTAQPDAGTEQQPDAGTEQQPDAGTEQQPDAGTE